MTRSQTIGVIGMGEMGAGLAGQFVKAGHRVLAVVAGRSSESRKRAEEAGIEPVDSFESLFSQAGIVFSVVPPSAALSVVRDVAVVAGRMGSEVLFVEANAISPGHARDLLQLFTGTDVRFVDGGLVGPPPDGTHRPRLYVSGPHRDELAGLDGSAFDLIRLGEQIGEASAFKMTFAAVTKGVNALLTNVLLAAEINGFLDTYVAEIEKSQPAMLKRAESTISRLPSDAGRWVREMEEISASFRGFGLPGEFHDGAAEIMRLLDHSPFGTETRRTFDKSRSMTDTIKVVAGSLANRNSG